MRIQLENMKIVGGHRALLSQARFSRAPVVVSKNSDQFYIVRAYEGPTAAEADELSKEEWEHLLVSGEAFKAESAPLVSGAAFWLFRKGPAELNLASWRKELEKQGSLLSHSRRQSADIFLIKEPQAYPLRDGWVTSLYNTSWDAALKRKWKDALNFGELAWLLDRFRSPITTALYAYALEQLGHRKEAEAVLSVEANSSQLALADMVDLVSKLAARLKQDEPRRPSAIRSLLRRQTSPTFTIGPGGP